MRKSLSELIGDGEYELAAHRLVYGAVKARLNPGPRSEGHAPPLALRTGAAGSRERREGPDHGRSKE